jgi:DNA-binding NarL/FixJ family response regulator
MTQTEPATLLGEGQLAASDLETARLLTIIISAPGPAGQLLQATLKALPAVQVAGTAAGCLSALQMLRERQVDLVVLDANLPFDEVQAFLRQLQQEGRDTHCLVLAETASQVDRALAAGAAAALRWDASLRELGAAVAELHGAQPGKEQRSNLDPP